MSQTPSHDVESSVINRYADGAREVQPALCCATEGYHPEYLEVLPQEIIDKDYGCGDPSKHAKCCDRVVDLGSGTGKICYILSQVVGPTGSVIGVDFNDAMLELARKHQPDIAAKIGHDNVRFVKARIQDLATDLENPEAIEPMIADGSVDLVVSNCVLNLVQSDQKRQLFNEIHRVLADDGRAVISDIVADSDPTPEMMDDPELWSGCISGALREDRFVDAFTSAGFGEVEVISREEEPWQTVDGIAFRAMTVRAWKSLAPKSTCCAPSSGKCC